MKTASHSTDNLILTFDGGTQSIRCGLFDVTGQMVDFIKIPIQPYFSEQAGFAEQHPDYYWEKFCETSRLLIARNSNRMGQVKAVAVTAQRGVYFNLDKDGKALRPAISWLDQRSIEPTRWAPFYLEAAFKAVGVFNTVDRYYRQAPSNWIRKYQPEIWEKTYKYLLTTAFFYYKLTGNYSETIGNAYGYLPIDRRTFGWAKKNDLVHLLFPIEQHKLPKLVNPGESIGTITAQAGKETGIPAGLPLIAAAGDKECEILGTGVLNTDVACLSLGTCSTINTVTDQYLELKPYMTPYPAAIAGHYLLEISLQRGFWMVSWFKEQFGFKEQKLANQTGRSVEDLLEDSIRNIPAGSQGLMLQPYWGAKSSLSDEEAKGATIGFSELHTRGHFYRAMLEGIMYALREGGDLMQVRLKKQFKKLRVAGGGAKSNTVLQIAADLFNLPVEHLAVQDSGLLGAAINAAVGLGYYPDYSAAVEAMVHVDRVVQPIQRNHEIYNHLFERVYRKMYNQLKLLYKEIWDIASQFPEEMLKPVDISADQ